MMLMDRKLKYKWHSFWLNFYHMMFRDCLDAEERKKIQEKIDYHQYKLST